MIQQLHRRNLRIEILCKGFLYAFLCGSILLFPCQSYAKTSNKLDSQRLANAIFRAENSKNHPYGILRPYCTSKTPDKCRKGCIQTINKRYALYEKEGSPGDFITYLSRTYSPIGAKNDPHGLNKFWIANVTKFYGESL